MELFREQKTCISCGPFVSAVCHNLDIALFPDSSNSFSHALFHFSAFLYIHFLTSPPSVFLLSLLRFCAFGNSRYFFFVKFDPRIIWYVSIFFFLFSVIFFLLSGLYALFFPILFTLHLLLFLFTLFLAFISISSHNFETFLSFACFSVSSRYVSAPHCHTTISS